MPLFRCSKCNAIENTALSLFWSRGCEPMLCSECDPKIGKWHGKFPKLDADAEGYAQNGNFLDALPVEVDDAE